MALERVKVGRQQGQWLRIRAANGQEIFVEAVRCCNGFTFVAVESDETFAVETWDDGTMVRHRPQLG